MRRTVVSTVVAAAVLGWATQASAAPIGITCDEFGELDVTFGGAGIPNDRVCYTTFEHGDNTITLGLTATQRFGNPAVTDDGAGTFFAVTGGDTLNGEPTFARWNFDLHISVDDGGTAADADYLFNFFYDFDPAAGTDESALGIIGHLPMDDGIFAFPPANGGGTNTFENSWNLGMAFLATPVLGAVDPPIFGPFSPAAEGQYSFGLTALTPLGAVVGRSSINVETLDASPVPEPGSLMLLGGGLLGLVVTMRRRTASRKN